MSDEMSKQAEMEALEDQLEKLDRIRQGFAAHLGASLYEVTKDVPSFREGHERLYGGIAACDAQAGALRRRIEELQAPAEPAPMPEPEAFAPEQVTVEVDREPEPEPKHVKLALEPEPEAFAPEPETVEVRPADAYVCPHCGSPVEPTHKFCMSCGAKLGE